MAANPLMIHRLDSRRGTSGARTAGRRRSPDSFCRSNTEFRRLGSLCDDPVVTSYVSHTTVDCADAYTLSRWWEAVLDYSEDPDDPNEPGHEECMIYSRDGRHRLLFIEVPDVKQVKNRIHLDLRPVDRTRDAE